ncbi:hypothetical protein [Pseudonocardia acaciae]|uniref:hypothetical protein n=1 Tax=Pseudonocardia acaciae TaxID=551276 RepID=UPI0007E8D8CB|nr:hypothetical protein [Pseudonocardia acaciae]
MSRSVVVVLGGLAVGILGLLVQWMARPEVFGGFGFPPGIVYIAGAGLIVWADRRSRWSPAAAIALALWIVVGGLAGGDLVDNLRSGGVGLVAGNLVMVAGLLVAAAAGVVAIARARPGRQSRPLGAENPRRPAVIVTVVSLVAVAVGDAAPEGLDWDGPGPALFVILAIVVALVPGRAMILLSCIMCVAFLGGAAGSPDSRARFADPSRLLEFGSAVLQTLGLVVGLVAGIAAAWPVRAAVTSSVASRS